MILSAVVSTSRNWVIGKDGKMPWYQSEDLKRFRKLTINNIVIMGKKTYQSIGNQLDKRVNIIITRDKNFQSSGCYIVHSIEDALETSAKIISDGFINVGDEVFIIGGGEIYKQFLPLCDKIYLTMINEYIDGDTFFPEISFNEWDLVRLDSFPKDDKNEYESIFEEFIKNKK